jgi:hypothetical protein
MQETLCRRRCLLKIPKNYTGFTAKTNVFAEHNQKLTDWMVERGEFELPVPISEPPDDNMTSGSGAPDEVSGSREAQTAGRFIRSATTFP